MKKLIELAKKSKVATTLALAVVAVAQASVQTCVIFVFGQEDMPEELL